MTEIPTQVHRTQSILSSHTTPLPCPMKAWGPVMSGVFPSHRGGMPASTVDQSTNNSSWFHVPREHPKRPIPLSSIPGTLSVILQMHLLGCKQMGESGTYNWKYNLAHSLMTVRSIVPLVSLTKPPPLLPLLKEIKSILQGPLTGLPWSAVLGMRSWPEESKGAKQWYRLRWWQ